MSVDPGDTRFDAAILLGFRRGGKIREAGTPKGMRLDAIVDRAGRGPLDGRMAAATAPDDGLSAERTLCGRRAHLKEQAFDEREDRGHRPRV